MFKKLFGDSEEKTLKKFSGFLSKVNSLEPEISNLPDSELSEKTIFFKKALSEGKTLDDIAPEAFAVVREVSKRLLGERHYDVQIVGGKVIAEGNIAEMRTGEGKTLVATLPAYLHALTGQGVHIITVNDYLARRDAVWMGQIYSFLGISVGVLGGEASYIYDPAHKEKDQERDQLGSFKVIHEFLRPVSRREAYLADITYGTNSEFGFDYLRDNLEYEPENLRQRSWNFGIIDEIDSILIDEARTPLIISAPMGDSENLYDIFSKIVKNFSLEEDYTVDEKHRSISLTDSGISKAERALGVENIYTEKGIKYVHHLETAVRAKALFHKDKQYVIKEGEVIIVDEFTGRLQPSRRWSDGLHQAIEAKEGVNVRMESRTFASITYQNYFKLYDKLAGMTGTAKTSSEEFFKVYGLDTVIIPTHRPIKRLDQNDLIYQTKKGKETALARKVKELQKKGQPVLIGTVSIDQNEILSERLKSEGVPHEVLNAKNHEREAEIIAQAGRKGAVTIATNMAGRGVDIKLGGVPFSSQAHQEIVDLGGLYVFGTERHDARRIDNQLRGRSGRQGDPGETQFMVSLEDDLMRIFASGPFKNMINHFGIPEDEPIKSGLISKALESAQAKIEGFNFDARKSVLEFDNVLNFQRTSIYKRRRSILLGSAEEIDSVVKEILEISPEAKEIIDKKISQLGEKDFYNSLRRLILQTNDLFWVDHLELMDYTRSSVNLRAYGQRDPLVEYKKEALRLFKEMNYAMKEYIIKSLPYLGEGQSLEKEEKSLKDTINRAKVITAEHGFQGGISQNSADKIGRNELVSLEKDGKKLEVKFKKAEGYLKEGWTLKR